MKLARLLAAALSTVGASSQSLTELWSSTSTFVAPAPGGRVVLKVLPPIPGSEVQLRNRLSAAIITTRYGFGHPERTVEVPAPILRVNRASSCWGPGCSALILEIALPVDLRSPPGIGVGGCDSAHYLTCDHLLSVRDNGRETHLVPFLGGEYSPSFPPCVGDMACETGQHQALYRRSGERVSLRALGLGAVEDSGDGVLKTKLRYVIDYVYRPKPGVSIENSSGVIPVEPVYLPDLYEYALRFDLPPVPEGARGCFFEGNNLELTLRFADGRTPLARADLCVRPPE